MSTTPEEPLLKLGRLRLLLALDALLTEGGVGRAAARMGISAPAMSRLLAQIREIYQDPIFVRSSRRVIPTPFAESLRQRVRALAAEAEALLRVPQAGEEPGRLGPEMETGAPVIDAAPLAARRSVLLEGEPGPEVFARKLAEIEKANDGCRRLAKHIATAGAGIGQSRPLTMAEAEDAFSIVLTGEADPVQVGALLATMHYRGETAAELAGMARASRDHLRPVVPTSVAVDLDWPSYISPKSRRMPWFLQAARLVSLAGVRVILHGIDGGGGMLASAARILGIPVCAGAGEASSALSEGNVAYLPLGAMSSQLDRLLSLYRVLETRSPVNSLMPLLNPFDAAASVMGVVRPAYRELHRDAGMLLGSRHLTVMGMSRDAAEATPFRPTTLLRIVDGAPEDLFLPAAAEPKSYPLTGMTSLEYWRAVWEGTARDERAAEIIVATAAVALLTVSGANESRYDECRRHAAALWAGRDRPGRLRARRAGSA